MGFEWFENAKIIEMIERFSSLISVSALSVTMILFVAANGMSYLSMQSRLKDMFDGYAECGFPFSLYGYGGFAPSSQILWPGLITDYVVAMFVSVTVGVVWKRHKR